MDDRCRTSKDAASLDQGAPTLATEEWPTVRPAGHVVMFWLLASMAMLVFAPCVLLPVWIDAQATRQYEQRLAADIAALESQVAENDVHIEALRSDPMVTDRLMRRELNQRGGEQRVVAWHPTSRVGLRPAGLPEKESGRRVNAPPLMKPWLVRVQRWMPNWPWRRLFVDQPNRMLMLVMAGGLLATAFFLYGKPVAQRGKRMARIAD